MKNSNKITEWQRDLDYLKNAYDLHADMKNKPLEVFARILQSSLPAPEKMEIMLGRRTGRSLTKFIKTTGNSLIELQKLLTISLNLKLISIDEYHSLSESLNEIGEIVNNFIHSFNKHHSFSDHLPENNEFSFPALN